MKILSIECSATPCSAAVLEDGRIISQSFSNVRLTHSQTLMPMIKFVLDSAFTDVNDIEAFAVGVGPGSFTGIRIGISTVKGLAAAGNKKCIPVSVLRAMAENYSGTDCIVCAVMDARCNQVYNALFKVHAGGIERLCDDRALLCDELKTEIERFPGSEKIVIVGDGSLVFYPYVESLDNVSLSDDMHRFQDAAGVAFAACKDAGKPVNPEELMPVYLRLPQAERELKRKEGISL